MDAPDCEPAIKGFVMYEVKDGAGYIMRLMIDQAFQRHGYGRATIEEVVRSLCLIPEANHRGQPPQRKPARSCPVRVAGLQTMDALWQSRQEGGDLPVPRFEEVASVKVRMGPRFRQTPHAQGDGGRGVTAPAGPTILRPGA